MSHVKNLYISADQIIQVAVSSDNTCCYLCVPRVFCGFSPNGRDCVNGGGSSAARCPVGMMRMHLPGPPASPIFCLLFSRFLARCCFVLATHLRPFCYWLIFSVREGGVVSSCVCGFISPLWLFLFFTFGNSSLRWKPGTMALVKEVMIEEEACTCSLPQKLTSKRLGRKSIRSGQLADGAVVHFGWLPSFLTRIVDRPWHSACLPLSDRWITPTLIKRLLPFLRHPTVAEFVVFLKRPFVRSCVMKKK